MNAHKWSEKATAALAVLLVLALVSMASPSMVVHAATTRMIGIDDTSDALPVFGCSLREAIDIANAGLTGTHYGCTVNQTGSGAPITYRIYLLEKGPYVYTLTGASGEDGNASGDLDITANVIIGGEGMGRIIIDGDEEDRVLHICPGGGCGNSVTLTEVTIRNGYLGGMSYGGGIYNEGGALTVQNSTISSNWASLGGGICNAGGKVTLLGSTVSDNGAELGGGISSNDTLNVQDSTIGGPGAGNESYMDCGGIHNGSGTVTVVSSTISDNTGDSKGGGICNYEGTLTVQNGSIVSDNTAHLGGGIINRNGELEVYDSIVSANEAYVGGGGIYNYDGGTVTVDGSTIGDNTATGYYGDGGGIYNKAGTLTVQNGSTIGGPGAGNKAQNYGGGIYNEVGEVTVDGSAVISNTADLGGGTTNYSGTLNIWNSTIISNTADFGGGTASVSGTLGIWNSTFISNTAGRGGGVLSVNGTATVDGSTISANVAAFSGGGVYNIGGTLTVDDSIISFNVAEDGGGINSLGGTTMVTSSTINANVVSHNGGGIHVGGIMVVDDSTVSGNTASYRGGGIYNSALTSVTDSRILNNTAADDGGGVFSHENQIHATKVAGSCIVGNSSTSFANGEAAMQTATDNWWGSASGPSGVGPGTGDSVSDNVDYSGFLTEPILGCYLYTYLPLVLKH